MKTLPLIWLILLLSGCAPKFGITSQENTLRNTLLCRTHHNRVMKHSDSGFLYIDIVKNTELAKPYALVVTLNSADTRFRHDSMAKVEVFTNSLYETIKLKARLASSDQVEFPLTKTQLLKCLRAETFSFEIETLTGATLSGKFDEKNLERFRAFAKACHVTH